MLSDDVNSAAQQIPSGRSSAQRVGHEPRARGDQKAASYAEAFDTEGE